MTPSRTLDLLRVGGVQVAIDWSWVLIFALVVWSLAAGYFPSEYPGYGAAGYWVIAAAAALLFFASVVIHELAHAAVANRLGQPVRRITLFIFGGMAHLTREPSEAATELQIAAVGPLTSFALAGAFWGVAAWCAHAGAPRLVEAMARYLAYINTALAVFNLLPGFPLDGGRILRALLWLRWRDLRRATARAADWGAGIGFGLMALGVLEIFAGALVGGLWLVFIGMFLRGAARTGYRSLLVDQALGGATVRDLMITDPVAVPGDATVAEAIEAHFLHHGFGGYPVTQGGEIAGLVSLRQVRECPPVERPRRRVREIMRPADAPVRIAATAPVAEALRQMVEVDTGRLLVTDGPRVIGLITRTGITRFIQIRVDQEDEAPRAA